MGSPFLYLLGDYASILEHTSCSGTAVRVSHASRAESTSGRGSESASVAHVLTGILVSEDVQPIDEMHHAVAVYSIIFVYGTSVCCELTGDVALVLQDVVHLESQARVLEQSLRKLGVPDQFIPVHVAVCITPSALVSDVGGQRHFPRKGNLQISSIRVSIGFLIVFRTQLVFFPRI